MTAPSAFAGIAEKLGKLIPRLASNHDGEITATVAAIGRTLATARLDWHDLAQRVAQPSFDDVMATSAPSHQVRPTWQPPAPPSKAQASPQKPRREAAHWPTWAIMTRFERLAWMDAIVGAADLMNAKEAEAFAQFREAHYTLRDGWSRKDTNSFNRHVRTLWERGWRPDRKAA